jgi:segregation and condensation protein B
MPIPSLKVLLEAALLAYPEPLSMDRLLLLFEEAEQPEREAIRTALTELRQDYADRGIELVEVASGFRLQVRQELAPWIRRLWRERPTRYSRAVLETLALIVYRQPITRGEIEEIRGVSVSSSTLRTLLDRGWIKALGQRDVPGRPTLYGTTRVFLDYFNLKSLAELPPLPEIRDLEAVGAALEGERDLSSFQSETGSSVG